MSLNKNRSTLVNLSKRINLLLCVILFTFVFTILITTTETNWNKADIWRNFKFDISPNFTGSFLQIKEKENIGVNESTEVDELKSNLQKKRILFWGFKLARGRGEKLVIVLQNLRISQNRTCIGTTDRNELNKSDAILFEHRAIDTRALPQTRNGLQRWVIQTHEPQSYSYTAFGKNKDLDGLFNWTMNFHHSSDIQNGWGMVIPDPSNRYYQNMCDCLKNKTLQVIAIIGNCAVKRRNQIIKDLKKYGVSVDIYGRCGDKRKKICASDTHCFRDLITKYRFYLALENSVCEDFYPRAWEALRNNMVPIISAKHKVKPSLPTGSFINIDRFNSTKHLAENLIEITTNMTMYRTFFKWHKTQTKVISFKSDQTEMLSMYMRDLCQKLHSDNTVNIHRHLSEYWSKNNMCV